MWSRGRNRSGADGTHGPDGSSPREQRSRASLLLTLTILVWNLLAGAADRLAVPASPRNGTARGSLPGGLAAPPGEPDEPPPVEGAVGARPGSLTLRQRFLLGRTLDVNRAGWRELAQLPGLSVRTAKEWVSLRETRGPYRVPRDLLRVPGIKEKRLKKILPFLSGFANN